MFGRRNVCGANGRGASDGLSEGVLALCGGGGRVVEGSEDEEDGYEEDEEDDDDDDVD